MARVAVVVGATQGWGEAVAHALAASGLAVVVNGRRAGEVARVVDAVRSAGGQAHGVAMSAATRAGARAIVGAAVAEFGGVDVLVNSAGLKRAMSILDITESSLTEAMDSQLLAPFWCTHVAARRMVAQGRGGRIISLAGGAAVRGYVGKSQHAAGKGGVLAATLSWALDLAPHGITVNAVRGTVATPATEPQRAAARAAHPGRSDAELGFHPAADAAELVVWLAAAGAAGVTGRFIGIDGPRLTVWEAAGPVAEVYHASRWTAGEIGRALLPRLGLEADVLRPF